LRFFTRLHSFRMTPGKQVYSNIKPPKRNVGMVLLKSQQLFTCFAFSCFSRLFNLCRGLNCNGSGRALFEFVDGAGGVQKLLFAGVKRVALAADFRVQRLRGGTGFKSIAAGAGDDNGGIELGMNRGLHKNIFWRHSESRMHLRDEESLIKRSFVGCTPQDAAE